MLELRNLGNPSEFWEYFEQISKIPHCSGYEAQIRNYVKDEAEKFKYETKVDKVGNLLVSIPPKNGIKSTIILQSHLDMVGEKNENIEHDFLKDSLKLEVIEINGDKWVTAKGTTLGADNGTGIACQLALMKKIYVGELQFDKLGLDLLFTVNEEDGMLGAFQIEEDLIKGNQLINLDGAGDNIITVGSVGFILSSYEIRLEPYEIDQEQKEVEAIKIIVSGLLGGHSGSDINRGRANAIKLIARILWKLNSKSSIFVTSINGGKASNAIPREANSIIYIKKKELNEITNYVNVLSKEIKKEFSNTDDSIDISIQKLKDFKNNEVFSKKIQDKILNVLYMMPNGPISMHPNIKKLVFTSSNLASIITKKNRMKIITSQRSFEESSFTKTFEKITALFKSAGLNFKYNNRGGFSSWKPDLSSKLLKISRETYNELFKEEPLVQAFHFTLETGIFKLNFPYMEIISIAPNLRGLHSPDERLQVKSVDKHWKYLISLLKNLNHY